jgi:carboxypeptidase Q
MNRLFPLLLALACLLSLPAAAQDKIDSAVTARIIDEGMNRSKVMDIISTMTDVYGPRLTWSPEYVRAAQWAMKQLGDWGLANPRLESGEPLGRGWTLEKYTANVAGKWNFPLLSFPMAWSPGVNSTADIVYFDASTDSAVDTWRGKLGGKFVLLDQPRDVKAPFEPAANREADSSLLDLANADDPANRRGRGRRGEMTPEMKQRALVSYHKMQLLEKEGAAAILRVSRGDGGNIFVQGASAAYHPDTPWTKRVGPYDPKAPKILPQISVAAEHYNRLVRMILKGEKPRLEMNLEVSFGKVDSLYNIIAEIPGTDLADQVVMLGGHFDSWHGGTGATDDATGCGAAMEAVRILKALDLKPRRTIRVALWDGEEQGLHGSEAYVKAHFGYREEGKDGQQGELKLLPEAEKFSVYFNHDNGTGKFRGVYMQGNEGVRKIFRSWLAPFDSMGANTLTLANTGGTDHLSFDAVGMPGFQFIQDELDYSTRS